MPLRLRKAKDLENYHSLPPLAMSVQTQSFGEIISRTLLFSTKSCFDVASKLPIVCRRNRFTTRIKQTTRVNCCADTIDSIIWDAPKQARWTFWKVELALLFCIKRKMPNFILICLSLHHTVAVTLTRSDLLQFHEWNLKSLHLRFLKTFNHVCVYIRISLRMLIHFKWIHITVVQWLLLASAVATATAVAAALTMASS